MSILAGSGVPILDALKIASEVIENLPMRDAVNEAAIRVREGGSISTSLATSKLFPPMMIHMISSGEASGRLEEMLGRAANGQEREVDSLIATHHESAIVWPEGGPAVDLVCRHPTRQVQAGSDGRAIMADGSAPRGNVGKFSNPRVTANGQARASVALERLETEG